jgi:polyphenol oxidase
MRSFQDEATGLRCYRSSLLEAFPEVVHGFFTRQGGRSPAPYDSLNLSFSVGDQPGQVAVNHSLVQQALRLSGLASVTQMHGRQEAVVREADPAPATALPAADILITLQPALGLLIKQADCQAVMLYDPRRRVIANIHCGWRGQVQNVLGEAVSRLRELFGTQPPDLYAAIGPSLGPCCAEFRNFRRELPPHLWTYQVRPSYFDLWQLSRDQLIAAGLQLPRIDLAGRCTRCHPEEFYSYRRQKLTGRQGAVLALRP